MTLPIFDLNTNKFTGENVVLDQNIFNHIVRRDIIHRVNQFNVMYNRKTTKWVRSKGEVAGSGKKPFAQKKTGRAHGARPRDYYFPLNKKIRLIGLKSILTSKFIENNIIIIKEEKISADSDLANCLKFLKENRTVFVTSEDPCNNFKEKTKELIFINHLSAHQLNVSRIISSKYLIFTVEGLDSLVELINERKINYYRNKKVPLDKETKKISLPTDQYKFDFDFKKSLKIYTPALKGSRSKILESINNPNKLRQNILNKRQEVEEEKKRNEEIKSKNYIAELYADDSAIDKRKKLLEKEKRKKELREKRKLILKNKKDAAAQESK